MTFLRGMVFYLRSDALEQVPDKGVQKPHRFLRDSSVGVDLLQNFVDVNSKRLLAGLLAATFGGFFTGGFCFGHFF